MTQATPQLGAKRAMHIWLVDPWDALPDEKGFQRGMQISRALVEAGHTVLWWQTGFSHAEKRVRVTKFQIRSIDPGIEVALLPVFAYKSNVSPARILSIATFAGQLTWRSLFRRRPDAIYVCGPIFFSEPVLLYWRWLHRVPLVFEFRDLWPETIINTAAGLQRLARSCVFAGAFAMRRLLLRHSNGVIGLNRTYLEIAKREAGVRSRAHFAVAYPSPQQPPTQLSESPLKKPPNEIWLISSGTLGASHDHQTLLRVAQALISRCPHVRFLITGSGPFAEEIERTIAKEELTNTWFVGSLPWEQFQALLAQCDIGLALYRRFSPVVFPTKIVDYLFAGLAVITSAQGESAELLDREGAGFSLPSEDSAALLALLEDISETRVKIDRAKEQAKKLSLQFESEIQINKIVNALERVVNMPKFP